MTPFPMTDFVVSRRPRLVMRHGAVLDLPGILSEDGVSAVAVITGGRSVRGREQWALLVEALLAADIEFLEFTVRGEPSPEDVDRITVECRRDLGSAHAVVAIGGGSVIDAAKAVAAMLPLEADDRVSVREFVEGVGTRTHPGTTLPLYAVPTTAGTGTEASKNAVLSQTGPAGFKKSLRHEAFVPHTAIIDPALHVGCPAAVTRASGLDAITQLIEAFVSTQANPVTDALCREGLRLAGATFTSLLSGEEGTELRASMALAAHFSGIALAQAGLGLVHGFASPLGAAHDIPHGVVCGLLVGPVTRATCAAAETAPVDDISASRCLERYAEAAVLLGASDEGSGVEHLRSAIAALVGWLEGHAAPLGCLADFGFRSPELPGLAEATGNKNNPLPLDVRVRHQLLESVLGGTGDGA